MRPAEPGPRILPFGDDAILVDLGVPAGLAAARRAGALARAIEQLRAEDSRIRVPVPGAASVLVPFDPVRADTGAIGRIVEALLADLPPGPPPAPDAREHRIAVRYGGEDGPDLDATAALAGLSAGELVASHAGQAWEVLFLGFAPGFAYLGELPERLALPRLSTPRTRVPAGSVAIADRLTAVYPHSSPGGWRVIGRTDARLFDPTSERPVLLQPGDRVRFVPA